MDPLPIDPATLTKLLGIPAEEAQDLIGQTETYMTELADEVLSRKPDLRAAFEAEYEKLWPILGATGALPADRETYVRQKATAYGLTKRAFAGRKKVRASDVAEAFGGELPPGWDDLPPEMIERDIEPI